MKKWLLLGVVFLVGCGTAQENETQIQSASVNNVEVNEEGTEQAENEVEEVIPTERTVETGVNYPWQQFSSDLIAEYQAEGETVYLYSDADLLERDLIKDASRDDEGNAQLAKLKEDSVKGFAVYLDQFIDEVSQHVDNEEYFNKLREVEQALLNADYENVVSLVNEATQIRESE